jgi:hypothetical protein
MGMQSKLFLVCRLVAALLLSALPAQDQQCGTCGWNAEVSDVQRHNDGECWEEWAITKYYYCGTFEYSYDYYIGYYCYCDPECGN